MLVPFALVFDLPLLSSVYSKLLPIYLIMYVVHIQPLLHNLFAAFLEFVKKLIFPLLRRHHQHPVTQNIFLLALGLLTLVDQ